MIIKYLAFFCLRYIIQQYNCLFPDTHSQFLLYLTSISISNQFIIFVQNHTQYCLRVFKAVHNKDHAKLSYLIKLNIFIF